jgi:hypothetical protein
MDSLVVLLLAERARSEGARSTRAIVDQPGYPCETSSNGADGRSGTNTGAIPGKVKRASLEGACISFDARSEKPLGHPLAGVPYNGSDRNNDSKEAP